MSNKQLREALDALTVAGEALLSLETLTLVIAKESKHDKSGIIHQLAQLGNYHAMVQANHIDCVTESIKGNEVAS